MKNLLIKLIEKKRGFSVRLRNNEEHLLHASTGVVLGEFIDLTINLSSVTSDQANCRVALDDVLYIQYSGEKITCD